jgi:type II secretory pathway predicted ATPase ExeA
MSLFLKFFGFTHHPFGRRTPKDAVFRHSGFDEALSRLEMTVELDSIAEFIADSGCGKSLVLGELAARQQSAGWMVHYFSHTTIGPFGLVNVLARRVGQVPRRSRGETADALTTALMEDGRSHLVIVDEAHELPDQTLQEVRLLTIADYDRKSPFLLLLAGQPLLHERLGEAIHHALDQRITTVARLQPLSADETRAYIQHRLAAAGSGKKPLFEDGAVDAVFDVSGGVPRRINSFATGAMIVAASRKQRVVTTQDVRDSHVDRGRP